MLRIGLTIYLMLTTVAGASICCCVPGRLAAMLTFGSGKSVQVVATTQRKKCCHQGEDSAPHRHKTPSRDQSKSGCPDRPSCPCSQPGLDTVLPSQDAEQMNQILVRSLLDGPTGLVLASLLTCYLPLGASLRGSRDGVASPFLSSHDILTTHHILRC